MTITPDLFGAFLKCPTKCWLRATHEPASGNVYAEWVNSQNEAYRATETERLLSETPKDESAIAPPAENLKTAPWRLAVSLTGRTSLDSSIIESQIQVVERLPSERRGKSAQFIPIRFIFTNKLGKDEKLMLAFDALVLSQMLGREVCYGRIIHGDDHATLKVKTSALASDVRKRIEETYALLSSPTPPDLILNRHCAECEFQARCRQKAIEKDDLSLLAGMNEKERKKLHSNGIFTVTQLSHTFRPRRRPKRMRDKREKYHHSLKALAIREKKIHFVGSQELKIEGTPVYLDVEGLPDHDFYYLIGLRIGDGESAVQYSLWADTFADEAKIWGDFLCLLKTVEQPVLIHYGSYETTFLKQMKVRYGKPQDESVAAKAIDLAINLVSVIFGKIYFHTYSNSLKEIAQHLNFEWSEKGASGTSSIVWRQEWEKSHADVLMDRLIIYNIEDCMALARLKERIADLVANDRKAITAPDVVNADSLPRNFTHTFKSNQFQLTEFKQINRAAYWDYQREKVLVRSSARLEKIARGTSKKTRLSPPNVILNCAHPTICPKCGGPTIYKHQTAAKLVEDLRLGRTSVKRWATKYRFYYYRCPDCKTVFHDSERGWTFNKFGPNLQAFCIYQIIELGLSQRKAAAFLNLILGFQLSCVNVNNFKKSAALYYQDTYATLQRSIVNGFLVHADETKVNLRTEVGYVWVFTNLEKVIYLYSPSREGELVQQVLKDFDGVLVTDFYAAYDSLKCAQQKCLIHLIRDLNEDAFKEPFNVEFKELIGKVAALLQRIIETVDRFGLKTRFLGKYKLEVDRFFNWLSCQAYRSETALKCKLRLKKKP